MGRQRLHARAELVLDLILISSIPNALRYTTLEIFNVRGEGSMRGEGIRGTWAYIGCTASG